jgi:hypothetical protein
MISSHDFQHFATALHGNGRITELEKAVACLWYAENSGHAVEMTAKELASAMTDIGLAGNVNIYRLSTNLKKSKLTVKGSSNGSFRVAPTKRGDLDERFSPLLKHRKVKVSDELLPDTVIHDTRKYLHDLAYQINGAYDCRFYDACAVLCRRMIESLLVECFHHAGKLAEIQKPDGNLEMLDAIVRKAKGGQHIRLPRGTPDLIDKIKEVGDTAAHDRYHITAKQDIDEFRTGFRKVISQLLGLAGITSKSSK